MVFFDSLKISTWFLIHGPILAKVLAENGQILPHKDNIWTFNVRFKLRSADYEEKWSCVSILGNSTQFGPFGPILTLLFGSNGPNWCKIYVQGSRMCEKVVLFASLRNSTWSLPFGPIFGQDFGPNGPTLAL